MEELEKTNKKVQVKVLEDFFDHYYGKARVKDDVFICRGDLAFKRKNFSINGNSKPLVEILRIVPDNCPEDEILPNEFQNLINRIINKQ